jgi:uncharacterized membrane protein YkgB
MSSPQLRPTGFSQCSLVSDQDLYANCLADAEIDSPSLRSSSNAEIENLVPGKGKDRIMNTLVRLLSKTSLLKGELDNHLIRASMVIIYFFFGYQKWFEYEAQGLIPFFTHGPLIFWMYPVFGIKGSSYFLGVSEWLFGGLLLAGFWNKKLGVLGALGSVFTFIATVTIIPFMPDGWAPSAGGFPAMVGNVAFLMKDLVLLAVSFYLLKYDLARVVPAPERVTPALEIAR